MDNRILGTIIHKFKGGPVGLSTIATAVGEKQTIEEVHEPFLIMEGYIQRTPKEEKLPLKPISISMYQCLRSQLPLFDNWNIILKITFLFIENPAYELVKIQYLYKTRIDFFGLGIVIYSHRDDPRTYIWRENSQSTAIAEVNGKWGGQQTLYSPYLSIPSLYD